MRKLPNIYEKDAHMCAFRVRRNKFKVWIRTLGAFYYDLLGSDPDYEITWKYDSEVIEEVKSIQIEVNKPSQSELGNDLQFKITIVLKTGTILAQGRNI